MRSFHLFLKAAAFAFTVFIALAAIPLIAQQSTTVTGGLNGTITDTTGALITGATVTIDGPQGTRATITDSLGHYSFSGLVPGSYSVKVERSGFKSITSTGNQVLVGVSSTLNLKLSIGETQQTIQVSATAVNIDTQSTAISSNLSDTFFNKVPMPRTVSAIFYAAPGVAGGQVAAAPNASGPGAANPSIGGSTGLENLYLVDGVTVTDQGYGALGTFNINHGSLGTGINLAFIKEVDVKSYGFQPQYGKAQGGIIQIVTKSGSNKYHGALSAYLGPGAWYADRNQFYQYGYLQTTPSATLSSPHYEVAAEFGGYIPHFQNKIFFFGAFDPSLDQNINKADPNYTYAGQPAAGPEIVTHGPYAYSTTAKSWAGKLTFQLFPKLQFEAAAFGDPSVHNSVPRTLSTADIPSSLSSYKWGTRDSLFRLDYTITPSWIVNASYTYNVDVFNEIPSVNNYLISDHSLLPSGGNVSSTGFGSYIPSDEDTYSIIVNTQKTAHFLGEHTFSVGYSYDHTRFFYNTARSGALFAIPGQNAAGTDLTTLFSNIPAKAKGAMSNGQFTVYAANPDNLADTTCTYCATWNGTQVYASLVRGTYEGFGVHSRSRYHAAYGEDVFQLNRYVTIDAGLRWEEQRVAAGPYSYAFTGSWSPRMGINIDPFGDGKGKVFFNFGRNYWAIPLDAANRVLGNEQDDTSYYFKPEIVDNKLVIVPDSAHTLNGLPKSTTGSSVTLFGAPSFTSSTAAEGILSGTKGEYEDEYVLGIERQIGQGMVIKAHYIDRRLRRIVEDVANYSPEGSTLTENFNGGITNPNASTDIGVNEDEVTYTPAQWAAANPNAGQSGWVYAPPVDGCAADGSNDTYFSAGGIWVDGYNKPIGGACFKNVATMNSPTPDGKPDGFVNPVRRYQALELEFDKRFSNNWLAVVNYRYGRLWGNYEGAYRNDNGQSDPGISSLFDFTAGHLGLLGDQFRPGWLSTDRRSVGNLFLSYTVAQDTPFFHGAKGLTVGASLRGQSGVPLSYLGDHPIYLNQGEVPIGGRGAAGRTPSSVALDMKSEYDIPIHETKILKLGLDTFNVTNSQFILSKVQFTQQSAAGPPVVGSAPSINKDYGRPTAFQGPFYARATIRFEF